MTYLDSKDNQRKTNLHLGDTNASPQDLDDPNLPLEKMANISSEKGE